MQGIIIFNKIVELFIRHFRIRCSTKSVSIILIITRANERNKFIPCHTKAMLKIFRFSRQYILAYYPTIISIIIIKNFWKAIK